jgi:hypothetical protein
VVVQASVGPKGRAGVFARPREGAGAQLGGGGSNGVWRRCAHARRGETGIYRRASVQGSPLCG